MIQFPSDCYSNMEKVFDIKCSSRNHCWYCKERCEYCLQYATFGLSFPSSTNPEIILRFCSSYCQNQLQNHEASLQFTIQLLKSLTPEEQKYIPSGCKELFRIRGHLALRDKGGLSFSMSVRCDSDRNYFVLYSEHQQLVKQYSEFFITSNGDMLSYLPHVQCEMRLDEDEFVLFKCLGTHIKLAFACYEKFVENEEKYKCSCVTIPVGIDSRQNPFFKSNIYFPNMYTSRLKTVINCINASRIVLFLEDQESWAKYLISAVSEQLQEVLNHLPTDKHEDMIAELSEVILKFLVEIILGW